MSKSQKFNASINFGASLDPSMSRTLKGLTRGIDDISEGGKVTDGLDASGESRFCGDYRADKEHGTGDGYAREKAGFTGETDP
jgi:hypothetical protein